jgi:hypothetical protein
MTLPPGFPFTQTALRAYLECPYRFRLRYVEGVPWSALPPEPGAEAALLRGQLFHELAREHFLGLEADSQAAAAGDEVAGWWSTLRAFPPDLRAYPQRYPEAGLSIPLGRYRLAARYDLLATGPAAAVIVDWKTGQDLASRDLLAGNIQTRVYLYVLAEGGAAYHAGQPWPAQSLGLVYWHPRGPQEVRLGYSPAQQAADRGFLTALVDEIAARRPEEMRPTQDGASCSMCAYGPVCGQGAGGRPEWEGEESDSGDDAALWADA